MSGKVLDLFSGAGGFSLAAHRLGLTIEAAIEFDSMASHTYRENIVNRLNQKTKILNEDILSVDPDNLRNNLGLKAGELTLILGGPPCQGFSSHRLKDAGVNDPRNKLLFRYFDFVQAFSPKAFLVENVSGLFWKRHKEYLDKFIELANGNNYKILFCGALNAKDYGVPQNRKRAFILGVRKDINKEGFSFPPPQTHFSPKSEQVKSGSFKWRTASSVFEPLSNRIIEKYIEQHFKPHTNLGRKEAIELLSSLESGTALSADDPCNVHMQPTEKMRKRFEHTRLNGSRIDAGKEFELKCHANNYSGHKDVYGRICIHQPSNTITTGCNNPSKGRFVHPWRNHGITLRHASRLQTFPDDFIFYGSNTQQAKQIGNAVPPLLGEVLINEIINGLDER
ncbi:DNA cytosine methyltransferase [Salinivibrio kushneri]|uniref:DNA cytosine methyltransferase n=1 Tax=Salinivibrio kushneri TaxID=1908198 RepID=UPI000986B5C7|nr:DNA cytosine methyltransferase [Salinivibrio kushneri]OOE62628.1 DNA (cytosine-5-)-methyltransferase [Salinivibrio kushneri]